MLKAPKPTWQNNQQNRAGTKTRPQRIHESDPSSSSCPFQQASSTTWVQLMVLFSETEVNLAPTLPQPRCWISSIDLLSFHRQRPRPGCSSWFCSRGSTTRTPPCCATSATDATRSGGTGCSICTSFSRRTATPPSGTRTRGSSPGIPTNGGSLHPLKLGRAFRRVNRYRPESTITVLDSCFSQRQAQFLVALCVADM